MNNADIRLIRCTLEDNGFRECGPRNSEWSVMWSVSTMRSQNLQNLSKYQKVNHFPRSYEITRKDMLYQRIARMLSIHGSKHFGFVPKTHVLPAEYHLLVEEMQKDKSQLWILKPSGSSQGKGILLANQPSDIPPKQSMIASHYISNPLLLNGYKFDLRIYVAITCINPLRIYMYKEGLGRFATAKYVEGEAQASKDNKFVHLTNYSINKFNENFQTNLDAEQDDVGSKQSLAAVRKHLRNAGIDDELIWRKIEDIVIKTLISAEPYLNNGFEMFVPHRTNCFELLGFDILIDNKHEPWLLEVNLSPSLNCDSPLDQKIKASLIADLLTLCGVVPLELRM